MGRIFQAAVVAGSVVLAFAAAPAAAIGPNQNSTATARIVKPLTLTYVRDLNLGTIVLSGAGTWTGAIISISRAGAFSCSNSNVTCSGATQTAQYRVTGTNNQTVTISAPDVTMTNQTDGVSTLLLAVDNPGTVNLANSGTAGLTFDLGGQISVASTTPDGTYAGTFNVTVNY